MNFSNKIETEISSQWAIFSFKEVVRGSESV